MLHPYFLSHLSDIKSICEKYKVKKLYAFGSIVDGRFQEGKSDIDLLVELRRCSSQEKARILMVLWIEFQTILNCEIDLITKSSIRDKYFKKYLELYKELVYEYVEKSNE